MDLRTKIIELFEYRRLPELMKIGNGGVLDEQFLEQLIALQASIYHLDNTLETVWEVQMPDVKKHWEVIHSDLHRLGVHNSAYDRYSRQIYKYQKHELDLRLMKLPGRLSMEYFYFYKSCDVKLLRKLIYDRYPILVKQHRLSDWRVFDLITEVNDDVEDVFEDLHTINGNRFLLSILTSGIDRTGKEFHNFLSSLECRLAGPDAMISEMTQTAFVSTQALLKQRLSILDPDALKEAKIYSYLQEVLA